LKLHGVPMLQARPAPDIPKETDMTRRPFLRHALAAAATGLFAT